MNVFIILSILVIVIGVILLLVNPSVLFKLNWSEKTGKEKFLMFMFYGVLVYIVNIIFWIIK
jgi:predicted membrane channel-forming protein YqfA (hemolysin III family)|tara:strand:+ start:354 stop:539 length:186 start_codon:yes stop_codon:yes gene_type:complete